MSTALPGKTVLADTHIAEKQVSDKTEIFNDRRIVSADRIIDHYHQLVCTATDARDTEAFFARSLAQIRLADTDVTSFLGLTETPGPQDNGVEYHPSVALDDALSRVIAPLAARTLQDQASLAEVATSLRRLHQDERLKVLTEADTALRNGMRTTGRDRLEDLRDALRLLRTIQSDPVSGRDYYVWFHIGWILWQMEGNFADAEEAFYQAARLSSSASDLLHFSSIRHQAYMQYLQNKHKQAFATIGKALTATPDDAEILFDAARYAACSERTAEALAYLERSIAADPIHLAFALVEEDFAQTGLDGRVRQMISAQREALVIALKNGASRWRRALAAAHEAASQSGIPITIPSELNEEAVAEYATLDTSHADFFAIQQTTESTATKAEAVRAAALGTLNRAIAALDSDIDRQQRQIEHLKNTWELWRNTVKWLEKEAKEAGFSLTDGGPMEAVKLRMQRRLERVRDARASYISSKDNLDSSVLALKEQVPGLEKSIAGVTERKKTIEAARDWLNAQDI